MSAFSSLLTTLAHALDAHAIPYMIVGSFASSVHGAPRTTMDLDIVIAPSASTLDAFVAGLDAERFYVDLDVARDALARRSMFNVIDIASGWKIDFVIRKDRPFSIEELARRSVATIDGVEVPTASPEDTVIAKLEWSKAGASERQLADVVGILRVNTTLDRAYIARWVAELGLEAEWRSVTSSA